MIREYCLVERWGDFDTGAERVQTRHRDPGGHRVPHLFHDLELDRTLGLLLHHNRTRRDAAAWMASWTLGRERACGSDRKLPEDHGCSDDRLETLSVCLEQPDPKKQYRVFHHVTDIVTDDWRHNAVRFLQPISIENAEGERIDLLSQCLRPAAQREIGGMQ